MSWIWNSISFGSPIRRTSLAEIDSPFRAPDRASNVGAFREGRKPPSRRPDERSDDRPAFCSVEKQIPRCARDDTGPSSRGAEPPSCHPEERSDEGSALIVEIATSRRVSGDDPENPDRYS